MEEDRKRNLIELIKESDLIRKIDPNLRYAGYLGEGGFGGVIKVTDGNKYFRLKITHTADVPGSYKTLEREYAILEDIHKKTGITPKPVKLYTDTPCVRENRKGKHAYLTEFIKGKELYKAEKMSSTDLTQKLGYILDKIHEAGWVFGEDAIDLNANNILVGEDGKLYLLDSMLLVHTKNLTEQELDKALQKERERKNEIIRRYSS